jgi:uncharacterized protein YutE (UPF0331/DUF86 family)
VTDPALVAKKLARIETCVSELRNLAAPERLSTDIREERFVEHTLQIAIQAALDVAAHIVSDERLGEPRANRELFDLLERNGWIAAPLASSLRSMVGFRNVLVAGTVRPGGAAARGNRVEPKAHPACRGDGPASPTHS